MLSLLLIFFCLFVEAEFCFLSLTGLKLDLDTKLAWTLYSFLVSVSLVLSLWACAIMPVYRCFVYTMRRTGPRVLCTIVGKNSTLSYPLVPLPCIFNLICVLTRVQSKTDLNQH